MLFRSPGIQNRIPGSSAVNFSMRNGSSTRAGSRSFTVIKICLRHHNPTFISLATFVGLHIADMRFLIYETVNKIDGIKVLKGLNGKHALPEESHSSSSYIALNQNQTVRQIRLYNSDLTAKTDIEFSVHQGKLLLHAHDYIDGIRQPARELTEKEHELYDKFFGGRS